MVRVADAWVVGMSSMKRKGQEGAEVTGSALAIIAWYVTGIPSMLSVLRLHTLGSSWLLQTLFQPSDSLRQLFGFRLSLSSCQ